MTIPPIFTFAADNPDTPAHMRYVAAMDQSGPGMHWICFGETREVARDKLQKFWSEREGPNKTAARQAAKSAKAATPEVAPTPAADDEDPGDVL